MDNREHGQSWLYRFLLVNASLTAILSIQVDKVLTYLETHDLLDQTIVLTTAPHGEEFYEHGHTSGFSL